MKNNSIKEWLSINIINYFIKASKRRKVLLLSLLLLLIIFISRVGFLGDRAYKISKRVFNFYIPIIDQNLPDILISFRFEVENELGRNKGSNGKTYFSGDKMILSINSNIQCWMSIFCVDLKGIHGVYNNSTSSGLFFPKENSHEIEFNLDDTVGPEIYIVVASHSEFNFEKDIKPKVQTLLQDQNPKGPTLYKYWLDLDNEYYQSAIYFHHK
ncbi:hypothetical protein Q4Q35_09655 [Flavivirga aquimarina]|uniref:DUF4384 domain-containing protein n=1 Tax=Flavivirga aquimarina TaxID=2027862 RepID=A0ABT8WAI0_9FLAO|nr:hypothetical protein [Flavivirga aquimarina]MDO5970073.1 hypothetical protein [Flavivirga aquimarina]